MIKALLLILNSGRTWERIHQARHGLGFVFGVHLVPLLLITLTAEGWGMARLGRWVGVFPRLKLFPVSEVVVLQTIQFLASVGLVLLGAYLVKAMGATFHGRHTFRQSFTAVAYGLSPLFLCRLMDVAPVVSPWASWALGILLSLGVLYQGLPKIMEPDPPHAFGLYLVSSFLLFFISGILRFLTFWYYQGRFQAMERLVQDLAAKLPF